MPIRAKRGIGIALSVVATIIISAFECRGWTSSVTIHRVSAQLSMKRKFDSNETGDNEKITGRECIAWAEHEDLSYHLLSKEEAASIGSALLKWYRVHRRKLPWRGDPPPYDGSTAKSKTKNQPEITSFFSKNSTPPKEIKEVLAYGVWVSEIMLQQTRVEAVIPYYLKWMESFPTIHHLASASEQEVNAHWAGLGFYRRAALLHKGAKFVLSKFSGELPPSLKDLLTIPGIGPYTAAAIASIAFNIPAAVVDGNVCRVLSRLTGIANHIKAPVFRDKHAWVIAQQIIDAGGSPGELNQAMMELGATFCSPSGSGIDPKDPLRGFYRSTKIGTSYTHILLKDDDYSFHHRSKCELCHPQGIPTVLHHMRTSWKKLPPSTKRPDIDGATIGHAAFPIPPPKKPKLEQILAVVVFKSTERYLMMQRPPTGLLASQWEFPCATLWTYDPKSQEELIPDVELPVIPLQKRKTSLNSFLSEVVQAPTLLTAKRVTLVKKPLQHVFSHVRHTMWIEYAETSLEEKEWTSADGRLLRWMSLEEMKEVGITSGVQKILNVVKKVG